MRLIAVDWSGAVIGAQHRIWLAEASEPGVLDRLESGRTRSAFISHICSTLERDPDTVVGLDFGFAFPAWFMRQLGVGSGPELWAHVAEHGERWLSECAPPFWGRFARPRPFIQGDHFRRTEHDVRCVGSIAPKSMFQIGGAGSVGTGSIRGMPLLHALRAAGAHVWPFDPPGWPLVVEIYPRLLTGPVVKSHAPSRQNFLDQHFPQLRRDHAEAAAASEDAFDAAVSALAMAEHGAELAHLPEELDPELRLEGRIWHPAACAIAGYG
jgi:hypothetical protein